MMNAAIRTLLVGILISAAPVATNGQDPYAGMEQSQQEVDQMFAALGEYVGDVRFDEDDVRSLIEHWDEWDQFGAQSGEDPDEDVIDFNAILLDSTYREWTAARGLDADDWLRKTLRITMTLYRDQMMMAAQAMPAQMAQQMQMLEQNRAQMGEELYQQMKQGMEAAGQYGSAVVDSARHLPEPTPTERALLEKYSDQLAMIMDSGDEDEDEYEDVEYN